MGLRLPNVSQHLLEETCSKEYSTIWTVQGQNPRSGLVITAFGGSVVDMIYAYSSQRAVLVTGRSIMSVVEAYDLTQSPTAKHRLEPPFVRDGDLVVHPHREGWFYPYPESLEELTIALPELLGFK